MLTLARIPLAISVVFSAALAALPAAEQNEANPAKSEGGKSATPEKGANAPYRISIGAIPGQLRYDVKEFEVTAGSTVELEFDNTCLMPHNLLVTRRGQEMEVVNAAMAMGAEGYTLGYIPKHDAVIAATRLLEAGQVQTITFTAPTDPGDHGYVCTFPGHGNFMRGIMRVKAPGMDLADPVRIARPTQESKEGPPDDGSGITPHPIGTLENPLVMRTFMPNPILDAALFPNHGRGEPTPSYNPDSGRDTEGIIDTGLGLPAAVGISYGPTLSVCWDTTECRFLYAWKDGFLDMVNYWGEGTGSNRKSFDYVPRLDGRLVHVAAGPSPLSLTVGAYGAPRYRGYRLTKEGRPEFLYNLGSLTIAERIEPSADGSKIVQHFDVQNSPGDVLLQFTPEVRKLIVEADGKWTNDTLLTVPRDKARDFTVTFAATETVLPPAPKLPDVGGVITEVVRRKDAETLPQPAIQPNALRRGVTCYSDRDVIFGTIPEALLGADVIRTYNDDKTAKGAIAYDVTLAGDATVYVFLDSRVKKIPDWLAQSSFKETGMKIPAGPKSHYRLFEAALSAGTHTFGGQDPDKDTNFYIIAARKP